MTNVFSPEYLSRPARFFGALFVTTVIVDLDGLVEPFLHFVFIFS